MPSPLKCSVINLGCKVNRVESDSYLAHLLATGAQEVSLPEADLIIINTCTVTGEAEKKTRKAVRRALRENRQAQVVVTGCASAVDPDTYTELDQRVSIVPKAAMLDYLQSDLPALMQLQPRFGEGFPTRVGIKVQDGCDHACTYCIVHIARGPAYSMPLDDVVTEAVRLAEAGAKEIVLTGINLGSYSHQGTDLAGLLRKLLAVTEGYEAPGQLPVRFRISSVEPIDISDAVIDVLAEADGRVCRHLHMPLQAGSTRVLHQMGRPYTRERFDALVDTLYSRVPTLALSTDIICGFPGETDDDFAQTLELARECRFSKIHVFPYSKRAGTPAAQRTDQVEPEIKSHRAAVLRELGDALREADYAARRGTVEAVLVEPDGVATTESYHEVPAPAGTAPGDLVLHKLV